jgi:D-aspartate ligase
MITTLSNQVSFKETYVPVVLLYNYHYGSLGVERSLGRLGVNVYGVDPNPWSSGLYSRYCKGRFIWDSDGVPPEASVKYLLYIAQKIGKRSILIHTTDNSANWLADYADELSECYFISKLSPQLVKAFTSKKELFYLAKSIGVPTPEACFPTKLNDVEEYAKDAIFPVMLKEIYRGCSPRKGKRMFIARTKAELVDLYRRHEDILNPNFMLQEYIPGGDDTIWMFNGYFNKDSDCLFGGTGKKIRQSPIHKGVTSLGICMHNETVDKLTRRFMKSVGYRGILDIGYRYDARDGKYKVLDVNPRIGASFRLFVGENGLDVVRAQYLDLTGQTVPSSRIVEGRKWCVEDRDIVSSLRYRREKNLTFTQWMRSFCGVREFAWFALDDIRPFFMTSARFAKKVLSNKNRSAMNPYCIFPKGD